MMILKKPDLVRQVRPLQIIASELIVEAVLLGSPPKSVDDAVERFAEDLGESILVDGGADNSRGDIRHLAIEWLILNGFAKAKAVTHRNGQLSNWSQDQQELEDAAALEVLHGSNNSNKKLAREIASSVTIVGDGPKAVYVYTDSRLDSLGDICTKIGRHHHSGVGDISGRIAAQYGTGNPGKPVLRFIFAVKNDSGLETHLHRTFREKYVNAGVGTEWFEVSPDEVLAEAEKVLDDFQT